MSETLEEFYGYYVCFDAAGVKEIDDVLSAVANACRASHHTDGWRDDHFNDGETCEKKIQDAANKSAATLAARESELAEAQRRVAELEDMHRKIVDGIEWTMTNIADDMRCATPETDPWCKSLKRVHDLLVAVRKALLPPDRITHIPKESDDGEIH